MSATQTRCGFIAVLGAPNSGKSTLVNTAVGQKVSIVTQKVQTTRMPVRGIAMRGETQLIFVDTPGIFAPKRRLDRAMVKAAWGGAADADVVLLTVDSIELSRNRNGLAGRDTDTILEGLKTSRRRAVLVLNKIDSVKREGLLPLAEELNAAGIFDRVFMISASNGDGVEDLLSYCAAHVPEGPWLYPADQAADIPSRLLAAEITREKIYLRLHDELPYASAVFTELLEGAEGWLGPDRPDDLCRARGAKGHRRRQGRTDHQGHRRGGAPRARADVRPQGPPVSPQQGL